MAHFPHLDPAGEIYTYNFLRYGKHFPNIKFNTRIAIAERWQWRPPIHRLLPKASLRVPWIVNCSRSPKEVLSENTGFYMEPLSSFPTRQPNKTFHVVALSCFSACIANFSYRSWSMLIQLLKQEAFCD